MKLCYDQRDWCGFVYIYTGNIRIRVLSNGFGELLKSPSLSVKLRNYYHYSEKSNKVFGPEKKEYLAQLVWAQRLASDPIWRASQCRLIDHKTTNRFSYLKSTTDGLASILKKKWNEMLFCVCVMKVHASIFISTIFSFLISKNNPVNGYDSKNITYRLLFAMNFLFYRKGKVQKKKILLLIYH